MSEPKDFPALSREELLALVGELQRQLTELCASNAKLRAEIEQLKQGGKRQAAPFSRGTRVPDPQPPGRKPGSGTFRDREAPPPEAFTEPPVEVPVAFDACPTWGGPLAEERVDVVYTTELPELPRPQVTPYRLWVCRCTVCGHQVRGQPPAVAPDQVGATAHRQRSLSEVLAVKTGRARDFGEGLKARLQDALQLWHAYHDGRAPDFVTDAKALRDELTSQLRDRALKEPDHQRLLNELGWHHDRGNRVRFPDDPRIEPTNNRAERALRPAVIARKVSQCSKNRRGTHAFEAFTSVVRTLTKPGIDSLVEGLYHLFRFPSIQDVPP